jgi:DNA-binding LacI/PurR family transcriptional regulator
MIPPSATGKRSHRGRPVAATLHDVARLAGVSHSTVSRVLTGQGIPRPRTARAVERAVTELGYRVNPVARSLRTGTTHLIGVVVDDLQDPVLPMLVKATDVAARDMGYSILLSSVVDGRTGRLIDAESMVVQGVDGMILVCNEPTEPAWRLLLASSIPTVLISADDPDVRLAQVSPDNAEGSRLAARHLIELGHQRIAYIRGPKGSPYDQPRTAVFRVTCQEAGLPRTMTPELRGDGRPEGGLRAAKRLLASRADITAIACYNDRTAIGAIRALWLASLRVPEDVSVIGFDDIAEAAWTQPALTTITQRSDELGRVAVERLLRLLEAGPGDPAGLATAVRIPVSLQVRESTAPPS